MILDIALFDDKSLQFHLLNSKGFCFSKQELAELVHKVHLLCLLARGRLIDNACDDPLIQVDFSISFISAPGQLFIQIPISKKI